MWSILYEADGAIYQIGPFTSQVEAEQAAAKAYADGEFDIQDQHVYLFLPDHGKIELTTANFA